MKRTNVFTGQVFDFSDIDPAVAAAVKLARLRARVWLAVKLLEKVMKVSGGRLVMYTLTYAKEGDWKPGQVTWFLRALREMTGANKTVWVAELTKRGRVHYHVLALLPDGVRWEKPGRKNGMWLWGDVTWVTDGVKNPFYVMKYIQKGNKRDGKVHSYPRGCRTFGFSRNLLHYADLRQREDATKFKLPGWFTGDLASWVLRQDSKRVKGGVERGGLVAFSPWRLLTDFEDCDIVGERMKEAQS